MSASSNLVICGASAKQEKALLEKIRGFQRGDPENKKCVDCGDVGPTYVCMDYGSFICTTCSGLHREFNHKVKGVSVSKWTPEEIDFLLSCGNSKVKQEYQKHYKGDVPQPEPGQVQRLRHWLRYKYVDRRWADPVEPASSPANKSSLKRTLGTNSGLSKPTRNAKTPEISLGPSESPKKSSKKSHRHHHKSNSSAEKGADLLGLGAKENPFASTTYADKASDSFFPDFTVATTFPSLKNSFDPFQQPQQTAFSPVYAAPFSDLSPQSIVQPVLTIPANMSTVDALGSAFLSTIPQPAITPATESLSAVFSPTSPVSQTSTSLSSRANTSSRATPAQQLASNLTKSLAASQRYQGDPFAEISLDLVAEPKPIEEKNRMFQQSGSYYTKPQYVGSVLSPSMSISRSHSDGLMEQGKAKSSMDILTEQVAALKSALQETQISGSVTTATSSHQNSRGLQQTTSGTLVPADAFGMTDDFLMSAKTSKESSPFSQKLSIDASPLKTPKFSMDLTNCYTKEVGKNFPNLIKGGTNIEEVENALDAFLVSTSWEGFKPGPTKSNEKSPVSVTDWADFDEVPPFAASNSEGTSSQNGHNPFNVL